MKVRTRLIFRDRVSNKPSFTLGAFLFPVAVEKLRQRERDARFPWDSKIRAGKKKKHCAIKKRPLEKKSKLTRVSLAINMDVAVISDDISNF